MKKKFFALLVGILLIAIISAQKPSENLILTQNKTRNDTLIKIDSESGKADTTIGDLRLKELTYMLDDYIYQTKSNEVKKYDNYVAKKVVRKWNGRTDTEKFCYVENKLLSKTTTRSIRPMFTYFSCLDYDLSGNVIYNKVIFEIYKGFADDKKKMSIVYYKDSTLRISDVGIDKQRVVRNYTKSDCELELKLRGVLDSLKIVYPKADIDWLTKE